jgi:hypothetical protein
MTVAATNVHIASNIKWPNHNPAGFASPFENCIACTPLLRSRATYIEKNAGYTAYVCSCQSPTTVVQQKKRHTIAAPKNATHLSATSVPPTVNGNGS